MPLTSPYLHHLRIQTLGLSSPPGGLELSKTPQYRGSFLHAGVSAIQLEHTCRQRLPHGGLPLHEFYQGLRHHCHVTHVRLVSLHAEGLQKQPPLGAVKGEVHFGDGTQHVRHVAATCIVLALEKTPAGGGRGCRC